MVSFQVDKETQRFKILSSFHICRRRPANQVLRGTISPGFPVDFMFLVVVLLIHGSNWPSSSLIYFINNSVKETHHFLCASFGFLQKVFQGAKHTLGSLPPPRWLVSTQTAASTNTDEIHLRFHLFIRGRGCSAVCTAGRLSYAPLWFQQIQVSSERYITLGINMERKIKNSVSEAVMRLSVGVTCLLTSSPDIHHIWVLNAI